MIELSGDSKTAFELGMCKKQFPLHCLLDISTPSNRRTTDVNEDSDTLIQPALVDVAASGHF